MSRIHRRYRIADLRCRAVAPLVVRGRPGHTADMSSTLSSQLSVSDPIDLSTFDSRATTGFHGKKSDAQEALADLGDELSDLQERLFARGRSGASTTRVLVVLQGKIGRAHV